MNNTPKLVLSTVLTWVTLALGLTLVLWRVNGGCSKPAHKAPVPHNDGTSN